MPVTLERLFSVRSNANLPFLGSTPLKLLQACSASIRNALGLIWGGGGGGGVAPVAGTAPELGQAQDQEWETQQERVQPSQKLKALDHEKDLESGQDCLH